MVWTVRYVEDNPRKLRLPPQTWPFVKIYDGWLPGQVRIVRNAMKGRSNNA